MSGDIEITHAPITDSDAGPYPIRRYIMSRAEALELFPMSSLPEPSDEVADRALELVCREIERDHLMLDRGEMREIEFKGPTRDHPPQPSFRERFPNDPVRNRRARQHHNAKGHRR